MSLFLNVSELPAPLQKAALGFVGRNKSIEIVAATEIEVNCFVCFEGNRSVHVAINALTGENKESLGTWGGSTPFVPSSMGSSTQQIPEGGAVLAGETGYKTFVKLYVHPSLLDNMQLDTPPELSDEILTMLRVISGYKAAARKEYVEEYSELGTYEAVNPIIIEMVELELVKINKRGSISLTNKGKGLAPRHAPLKTKYQKDCEAHND